MQKYANKLAYRYAEAFLKSIKGDGSLSDVSDKVQMAVSSLDNFSKIWDCSPEARQVVLNPRYSKANKERVLELLLDQIDSDEKVRSFVKVINSRSRINYISQIRVAFAELVDQEMNLLRVEVVTASELSDAQKSELGSEIKSKLTSNAILSWSIDPEILGGLVLKYAGKIYDSSLKTKLSKLNSELRAN